MNGIRAKAKRMPMWLRAVTCALLLCLVATLVGVGLAENEEYSNNLGTLCEGKIQIKTTVDPENAEWESKDSVVKGYVMSSLGATDTTYTPNTSSAKITNISGKALKLSFEWSANSLDYLGRQTPAGTVSVKKETDSYSTNITGKFNEVIAANESVIVSITSATADRLQIYPIENITLSDFAIDEAAENFVHLGASYDGGYTVQTAGGEIVTVSAANTDGSFTVQKGSEAAKNYNIKSTNLPQFPFTTTDGLTVNASANTDKSFYLWQELKDGKNVVLSEKDGKIYPDNETTITPVFIDKGQLENGCFKVDNKSYYYWDDAMQAAAKHNSKVVTLTKDYTLPDTKTNAGRYGTYAVADENGNMTYNIPTGVTVVVPFDDTDTRNTDIFVDDGNLGRKDAPSSTPTTPSSAYRTLTVPQGATLNVNPGATLLVNAKTATYDTSNQSCVYGKYGKMVLGGQMDVSGTLYANGYIVDENHDNGKQHVGHINAKAGSKVYQIMQIKDFRGGTVTSAVSGKVMAINMYYFQNIMADITYKYGSEMKAQAALCPADAEKGLYANISVISNGENAGSMFTMTGGEVETNYDYQTDRLNVLISGNVDMQYLSIETNVLPINTKNYQLAVNDNMPITVKDGGALTMNYGMKFLPGAKVTVEKGGTLNISDKDSAEVFLYSKATYQQEWANKAWRNTLFCDLIQSARDKNNYQEARISADNFSDATIDVCGTLNIAGQLYQSKDHATGIQAAPGAVVNITKAQKTANITCYETYLSVGSTKELTTEEINAANASSNGRWTAKCVTDGTYYGALISVTNWEPVRGAMADGDQVIASQPFANQDKYTAVAIGDDVAWYRNKLTVNFKDAEGAALTGRDADVKYYAGNTMAYTLPARYVATKAETGSLTLTDGGNINSRIDNGWEKLTLTTPQGATGGEYALNLTAKQYNSRVGWYENYSEETKTYANQRADYITDGTASYSWLKAIEFKQGYPAIYKTGTDTAAGYTGALDANNTTYTIQNISEDIDVKMETLSDEYAVTYRVTKPDGGTEEYTHYVRKELGKDTFTIDNQPEDGWLVADTISAGSALVENNGTSVSISSIAANMTVDITLAKCATRVDFTVTNVSTDDTHKAQSLSLGSVYVKESGATTVSNPTVAGDRYAFVSATPAGDSGITAELNTLSNTLSLSKTGTVAKVTTVPVALRYYDVSVITSLNGKTVDAQYLLSGETYNGTIPAKNKIVSCNIDGGVAVPFVNPTNSKDSATITLKNVTKDTNITVMANPFALVVTRDITFKNDMTGDYVEPTQYIYVNEGETSAVLKVSTTAADYKWYKYVLTDFEIVGGGANINGVQKSENSVAYLHNVSAYNGEVKIRDITEDTSITATASQYKGVVSWTLKGLEGGDKSYKQYVGADDFAYPCINWNTDGTTTLVGDYACTAKVCAPDRYIIQNVSGDLKLSEDKMSAQASCDGDAAYVVTFEKYKYKITVTGAFGEEMQEWGKNPETGFYEDLDQWQTFYVGEDGKDIVTGNDVVFTCPAKKVDKTVSDWSGGGRKDTTYQTTIYGMANTAELVSGAQLPTLTPSDGFDNSFAEGCKSFTVTNITGDVHIKVSGGYYNGTVTYTVDNGKPKIAFVKVSNSVDDCLSAAGKATGTWSWTAQGDKVIKTAAVTAGDETGKMSELTVGGKEVSAELKCKSEKGGCKDNYNQILTYPEITVSITTDTPEFYALLGDMSYELHKNSATYKWDDVDKAFRFSPNETYSWRHRTGSVGHDVTFHNKDKQSYNVANGTVLLVNKSTVSVVYTAQLAKAKGTYDASWAKMEFSLANDTSGGKATIATDKNGVATITVPANSTVTLVTNMVGQPTDSNGKVDLGLNNVEIGSFEITGKALLN